MPKTNINDILKSKDGSDLAGKFTLDADIDEEKIKQRFERVRRLKEQAEERKKVNWYELENFIVENNYTSLNYKK